MWRDPVPRRRRSRDPGDRDVVRRDRRGARSRATARCCSSVVASQADLHARYGGVVPEVASRRHLELVGPVVREALERADATLADVDRVAVTQGPGLVGALLVGVSAAKALAWATAAAARAGRSPARSRRLALARREPVEPPFVCLLASGGHTQLLAVRDAARARAPRHDARRRRRGGVRQGRAPARSRLSGRCGDRPARARRRSRPRSPSPSRGARARLLVQRAQDRAALHRPRARRRRSSSGAAPISRRSYQRAIVRALAGRAREAAEQTGHRADRGRGRRGGEQRAPRAASRRGLRAARLLHRQRRDDRRRAPAARSRSSIPDYLDLDVYASRR